MNISEIKKQAELEYQQELFRKAVDEYKAKLRTKRTIWEIVFPYKIMVVKKGVKK